MRNDFYVKQLLRRKSLGQHSRKDNCNTKIKRHEALCTCARCESGLAMATWKSFL